MACAGERTAAESGSWPDAFGPKHTDGPNYRPERSTKRVMQRIICCFAVLLAIAIGSVLAGAPAPTGAPVGARPQAAGTPSEAPRRLREGTALVDTRGTFQLTADGAMFLADNGARFTALENLNLERVTTATGEHPEQLRWVVSGMITEFRGSNFLLLERTILEPAGQNSREPRRSAGGAADPVTMPKAGLSGASVPGTF